MTDVKLNRISKNVTTDGQLRCVFIDKLHPLTDEDGNPRLTGEVDEEGNLLPVYEYAILCINVTPADVTEAAIQEALGRATDQAMARAKTNAEKQEKRLALKSLMDTSPVDDPSTVYVGDAEAYIPSVEPTVPEDPV